MAKGDQFGRQWRIIQTLISSRAGRSASELAQELGCNPRTVYRDLEAGFIEMESRLFVPAKLLKKIKAYQERTKTEIPKKRTYSDLP
jgi:DeoR/GlpR family transcriptional regulator of sugar metabolism